MTSASHSTPAWRASCWMPVLAIDPGSLADPCANTLQGDLPSASLEYRGLTSQLLGSRPKTAPTTPPGKTRTGVGEKRGEAGARPLAGQWHTAVHVSCRDTWLGPSDRDRGTRGVSVAARG